MAWDLGLGGLGSLALDVNQGTNYTGEPALGGLEGLHWIAYSFLKTRLAHAPDPFPRLSQLPTLAVNPFLLPIHHLPFTFSPLFTEDHSVPLSLSLSAPLSPRYRRLHQWFAPLT